MRFSKIVVIFCVVFLAVLTIVSFVLFYTADKDPPQGLLALAYGGFCTELALTFAATASGNKADTVNKKKNSDGSHG